MYFRQRREYTRGETALEECQAGRFMPIVQVVDSQWVEQASDRTLSGAKMARQSMAKCAKSLQTLTAQFRMQVMEDVPAAAFVRVFRASVAEAAECGVTVGGFDVDGTASRSASE